MARFRDFFADAEITNWLKAWLGLNITRAGLLNFVDNETKQLKTDLYQNVILNKNLPSTTACTSCFTANMLKCPTKGLCKRTGKTCTTAHADPPKQCRPCPTNRICDGIRDEIIKAHRFSSPSWKNTSAEQWTCNHWEIAKCYMPPDGYTGVSSIQNTDFNGIINVLLNCKHFDAKFSFTIGSGLLKQSCFLTQAREIGKAVRHSSTCKVTRADLKKFFKMFIGILTDSRLLAQDPGAQESVNKLKQLQTDRLNIASDEMVQLLKDAQEVLIEAKKVTQESKIEMKTYIEKLEGQIQLLNNRVDECEQKIQHMQTSKETDYNQGVLELRRRIIKHYIENTQYVSVASLMPTHDISLMEMYATPAIHRVETKKTAKRKKSEPVFTYKGIFNMEHESKQRIFLQGEPGKGKSTFASKLVLDWCNECISARGPPAKDTDFCDTETLNVFKFVFLIALRDSRNQRKVTDMIKKQIIEKVYSDKDVDAAHILLQTILEKETCLVVQDGLDEWSDAKGEAGLPLLSISFQSIVLITTRPWKMSDYHLKNSKVNCLLEIEGVKDSFVLCRKVLDCLVSDDLDSKVVQFTRYIHDNGLGELLGTPMLITLIVCLWVDKTYLTGSSCQIYTILIDGMLKRPTLRLNIFRNHNSSVSITQNISNLI